MTTKATRSLAFGIATTLLLLASSYAKHEKMPLPQQVMTAKTIYIDNRSGIADLGDKAYDELRKWGRFQIVDSAEKADVVLLLSAKAYISGYSSNSYHNTSGSVDSSGNVTAQTYGNGNTSAIYSATTYVTIVDPKAGAPLWSDARAWGRWKSATRGLVKELRDRMDQQEGRK
jgi:cytochrome c5